MNYKILDMPVHGDHRGKLISLENLKNIPFKIKRVYYMYDTLPNEAGGFHAHKDLEQVIIAMDGACTFILDDGEKREQVLLNRPDFDLMRRLHAVSKTLYFPSVSIIHDYAKESYKNKNMLMAHIKSAVRYFNKWGWFFDRERRLWNKQILKEFGEK